MKILHLITSLEGGGTENFLHQLLDRAPRNLQQEVVFLKKDGPIGARIRELSIPVHKISNPLALWVFLRKRKPDVLHTLLYRAHQVGRVVGRMADVSFIVSSQRAIDGWAKPWHERLDAWTLRCCDAVLANSHAAERVVLRRRGARATPSIDVIPNGVDLSRFVHHPKEEARRLLHLPPQVRLGGTLMRLHPEKGADLIPSFAQEALTANPELHLAVAGVGPLEASLHEAVRHATWGSRVHWIGWTDHADLFLSALDFFWLLSREESFPQGLLEASIMRLPWIAPNVGGVSELLSAGAIGCTTPVPGLTLEMLSTGSLVDKNSILKPGTGVEERARGQEGRLRQRYSLDVMVQRFYEWVASLSKADTKARIQPV